MIKGNYLVRYSCLLVFLTAGYYLFSYLLPVGAVYRQEVVAEVEEEGQCGTEPEADDAPFQREHRQQWEGDADDPVADDGPNGRDSLLPEGSDDTLADTLDGVNEGEDQDDWVGLGEHGKDHWVAREKAGKRSLKGKEQDDGG